MIFLKLVYCKTACFFADAAHFVMASPPGFLWSVARAFIKASAGSG
jgi:hypothetical protein